jgi:hypothetical protein
MGVLNAGAKPCGAPDACRCGGVGRDVRGPLVQEPAEAGISGAEQGAAGQGASRAKEWDTDACAGLVSGRPAKPLP